MPIVEARWFLRSPPLPPALALNCATYTFPSPAWKIFSCTTPEGACANELEDFSGFAGARCSRRPPQPGAFDPADLPATDDVRLHFRSRDGEQRVHATCIQELALARDHGDQHGVHRGLGGRDAFDR